ncbi:MAG: hypothetical protein J6K72_08605 [Clostridia bacterium]|nr:hypothetical protein [Clostridia bacterium]
MIVYHVDTHKQLQKGQILLLTPARTPIYHLYPQGVCSYGERTFIKPTTTEQQTMQAIDIFFDYVRCLRFPNKPSRFTSVYASASLEESKTWLQRISGDFDIDSSDSRKPSTYDIPIYAVQCDNVYIADARFLDCESEQRDSQPALSNLLPYALAYWDSVQQIHTAHLDSMVRKYQKPELLLVPPVYVVEQVYP